MANGKTKINLPPLSARELMIATLAVGAVVLAVVGLFRFHEVVLAVLAGIIISIALEPAVARLRARGIAPGVAVASLYGVMFVAVVLAVRFGAPVLAEQLGTIGQQLSEGYVSIVGTLRSTPNLLIQRLAGVLPEQLALPATPTAPPTTDVPDPGPWATVLGYGGLALKTIFQTGIIFLIAFFWTIESERIKRTGVSLLPLDKRDPARELITEIEHRVGGYVIGTLTLSAIMGALALVSYLIIGLPYAPLLAIFVGFMEIIPVIGPIIGAVPALIIGFTISPLTAVWTVVASLIIHQLEANVFAPRVMNRALGIRPLVTLLALTAFGTLFGVLGAIVALPLASVLQLFFDRFLMRTQARPNGTAERDRIGVLRYEVQELVEDVRKMFREREEEDPEEEREAEAVEDALEAVAQDLDSFLAKLREPEGAI